MKLEDIVKEEIANLGKTLEAQVADPAERAAIIQMTNDLAMLPVKMAAGQDVTLILKSLQAEAALRGSSFAMRSQLAVQNAWINIVSRILMGALVAAV